MITMTPEERELTRKMTVRLYTAAEEIHTALILQNRFSDSRTNRRLVERRAALLRIANDLTQLANEGSWA